MAGRTLIASTPGTHPSLHLQHEELLARKACVGGEEVYVQGGVCVIYMHGLIRIIRI